MLQRLATGSWRDAFLKGIPSRKDLQLREEFVAPQKSSTSSSSTSISSTSSSSSLPRPTVLIIGGSSGIGKGFLTKFVQQNYNIIISSRSESKLSSVCSEIKRTNPTACLKYFVCDCTSVSDCDNLYKYVVEQWGQTERGNIIVHSAGDFKWDTDVEFKSTKSTTTSSTTATATATTTSKEYLYSSNVLTKMNVFKSCAPLLQHIDSKFIVIGSQAGQPSFKEEMEKKEGKGAVDNEAGYMFAMATLAKWTKTIQEYECAVRLVILSLTDVWSAIRKASSAHLYSVVDLFPLDQVRKLFEELCDICNKSTFNPSSCISKFSTTLIFMTFAF